MPFYKNSNLISAGGGLTPEQSQAIDDYMNPDYTRLVFDGPQVISTTASTIQLGTELEGSGIVYDPLDESVTFPGYDRIYVFNLSINGTSAGNNNAFLWAETFNGVDWIPFKRSGQKLSFGNNDAYKTSILSNLTVPGETKFRFRAKTDTGTVTLGDSFTDGIYTINVLASVLAVVSVSPRTP